MASTDQLKVNLNVDPSCKGVFEALCDDNGFTFINVS